MGAGKLSQYFHLTPCSKSNSSQYPGWSNHIQSARIDVLVKG